MSLRQISSPATPRASSCSSNISGVLYVSYMLCRKLLQNQGSGVLNAVQSWANTTEATIVREVSGMMRWMTSLAN
eukprot:scaffold514648_cov34-Prasinocladus_malaysianus.AAC.1